MKLNDSTIGTRIKNRRKELGITQVDVKNATGISSGNMSEIENGNRLPSTPTLLQLSTLLQCSIDWILIGESPNLENSSFSNLRDDEIELLTTYRKLPSDEKDEVLEILHLKVTKFKKRVNAKSSLSENESSLTQKEWA